jgi:hypothetical protein
MPFERDHRELWVAIAILLVAAALFGALHTHQYLAVDGALRCLSVYWLKRPTPGGNNHLLYFVNVFAWAKMLALVSISAANPFDFLRLTQWMNALAAAGSVTLFWILCCRASRSLFIAGAATGAYAFSNAFMLHATSTAEPMVGLFWSIASVSIVASGLAASSRLRIFAGGSLLLLAMATYESMVLIGPAELLMILVWNEHDSVLNRANAIWFLAGCVFGGLAAYVPVYTMSGTTAPMAILQRFLDMDPGSQVYGGIRASKLLNIPVGFSNSIVCSLPIGYRGIRSLLTTHGDDRSILLTLTTLLATAGWLAWTTLRLVLVWSALDYRRRLVIVCAAVALVSGAFPLIFWDPTYDKLWLQPLAMVFFAWSVIFTAWRQLRGPSLMVLPEGIFISAIFISGFTNAIEANASPTPCLNAARDLSRTLRQSDCS